MDWTINYCIPSSVCYKIQIAFIFSVLFLANVGGMHNIIWLITYLNIYKNIYWRSTGLSINSNGEDTTVINEKNCMMTPLLPFKSTIKSPPPVIRRSQHKYTNVYASLTIDKNKDILLELWSKSSVYKKEKKSLLFTLVD